MAEWKKVIVSGSDAELNTVTASFFVGDGSAITGVQASGLNIEGFTNGTGITVASTDKLLLSDGGTEKYINVSQLPFTTDTNRSDASVYALFSAGDNVEISDEGLISSTDTNTQLSTADVRGKISATGLISYNSTTGVISTTANNYVLPEATATTKGGIELFSNTDQTVAANTVSATAGRTYGLQLNSAGQAVVNVPWSDTNTNTQLSDAEVREAFSAGDNVEISDEGLISSTDTNTQLSTADVRGKISATGLVSYNSSTGVISTTANNYSLTIADVKSVLGGGMPSNALTIGDSDDTITIAGNLDVNGTTTTIDTANLAVADKFIELNRGALTDGDGGIVINGATNKSFGWDDSNDRWAFDFTGADATANTIDTDAFAAAVVKVKTDSNYHKDGNLHIDGSNDIWIYVE